jgi:hypothetical protein
VHVCLHIYRVIVTPTLIHNTHRRYTCNICSIPSIYPILRLSTSPTPHSINKYYTLHIPPLSLSYAILQEPWSSLSPFCPPQPHHPSAQKKRKRYMPIINPQTHQVTKEKSAPSLQWCVWRKMWFRSEVLIGIMHTRTTQECEGQKKRKDVWERRRGKVCKWFFLELRGRCMQIRWDDGDCEKQLQLSYADARVKRRAWKFLVPFCALFLWWCRRARVAVVREVIFGGRGRSAFADCGARVFRWSRRWPSRVLVSCP